jgi:hypothetical protein
MKISKFGTLTVAALTASAGAIYAQELTLNFGPLTGSALVFGGSSDTFNFTPGTVSPSNPTGNQWSITSESGSAATGSAAGDQGNLLNGPFTYGPITTTVTGPITAETASVLSPSGILSLSDGHGATLTGSVNFIDITTVNSGGGLINDNLNVNLTGVAYTGSDADLGFLKANQPGVLNLSFQFSIGGNGETLQQLSTCPGGISTSYNGSISESAVPEPTTFAMSGLGALGALGFAFLGRRNS